MKTRKGVEQIGTFRGIPLTVDWTYLLEDHGLRKELEDFERSMGRFLFLVGVLLMLGVFIADLANGVFLFTGMLRIDRLQELVFVVGFMLMLYSFFLNRNRENFVDRLQLSSLHDLKKAIDDGHNPAAIRLETYFDHDLLNVIDDVLTADEHRFMSLLIVEMAAYPKVATAIGRLGVQLPEFKEAAAKFELAAATHFDEWIIQILDGAFSAAYETGIAKIDELAMFYYICSKVMTEQLLDLNISEKEVAALGLWIKNQADQERYQPLFKSKSGLKPTSTVNRAFTSRYSPTLVQFQRDFTAEVAAGDFTYSIAREVDIEHLISSVREGEGNATLIVGPTGVGKTTLLKSLAVRMVVEDVPPVLQDKRLVNFDFARAYALSENIDSFKSKVELVLEETAKAGNIILVLEDFEQIVQIRPELQAEVVSLFVNAFERSKMRVIATTTPEGYAKNIKPESGLAAIFDVMELAEPSDEVCVQILLDQMPAYEKKNKIRVSFDAVVRLVSLSHKIAFDQVLPSKALDLLEESIVEAQNQKLEFVNEQIVEQVVSRKVGVKVGAIDSAESKTLMNMELELHKRIIGQEEAIRAVSDALRRSRAGLSEGKRPIAAFLFFGPTGVGKTELAKALTAVYYGDEKLMIRLDMSEYQEEANLERLIGAETAKGFEGGYLTDAVRNRPFSLVLLDEIEKANPKVLDLFLQVLDEGHLTDGLGRKTDFTNTIIIATSNAGSREIADLVSKGVNYNEVQKQLQPKLREVMRVEFLNRFDKVIMFRPLLPIEVEQVAGLMLKSEAAKLADKGIELTYENSVLAELAKLGYDPVYGARELRRIVQERIEDPVAKLIVGGKLKSGDGLNVESLAKLVIEQ